MFGSLQVIERLLDKTQATRAEHMEAQQALSGIAQYIVKANGRLKHLPEEEPSNNGQSLGVPDVVAPDERSIRPATARS